MEIGERITERREAAGLTIVELAERIGRSYAYARQLQTGRNSPPAWPLLVDIADALDTSTDYLLGRTLDPAPPDKRDLPLYGAEVLGMMRDVPDLVRSQIHDMVRVIYDSAQVERDLLHLAQWMRDELPPELLAELSSEMGRLFATGDRQAALDYAKMRLAAYLDGGRDSVAAQEIQ